MRFFSIDNGFFRTLSRIYDLIILNLLFLVTSIPVVTIGANLTALYAVTHKMINNEESYIWRSYWKNWKQNFRQATILWLVFLAAGIFLLFDRWLTDRMGAAFAPLGMIFTFFLFVWLMALSYVFPVLACFDNSTKNIGKNALLMPIRHLPWTVLILITDAVPVFLLMVLPGIAGALFMFLLILLGFSGTALAGSFIFAKKIFPYYIPEEEEGAPEEGEA